MSYRNLRPWGAALSLTVLFLLGGSVCTAAEVLETGNGAASAAPESLPRPDHVVIVIEENKGFSKIIGAPEAPFMNSLALRGALLTNSHGLTHPSQPNYLDLFAGSDYGVKDNNPPRSLLTGPSLGGQLKTAGLSFRGYAEDLPAVGATDKETGKYARKHCPWINFADVSPRDSVPLYQPDSGDSFPNNPAGFGALPTISFVVPNLDNDMHDGSVRQGDAWLQKHLGAYAEWAQSHNSLLVVTFDEDAKERGNNNRIPTVLTGQMVRACQSAAWVDHFGLLRTIQTMYGLPPLGRSAPAAPILGIWTAPAQAAARGTPPVLRTAGYAQP